MSGAKSYLVPTCCAFPLHREVGGWQPAQKDDVVSILCKSVRMSAVTDAMSLVVRRIE